MSIFVEVRLLPKHVNSPKAVYSLEWETPALEPAMFEFESEALVFARSLAEPNDVHQYRLRRSGQNEGFFFIN